MTGLSIFLALSIVLGFLMTWGVGANDLANVLSTSLGSKSITIKQALVIAIIFELAGALLGGSEVSDTMREGIIEISALEQTPIILAKGMLAILIAGTLWINLASHLGLPVSITHTIVGSFVGFTAVVLGLDAINGEQILLISMSWIFSPLLAAILAYIIFIIIQNTIFMGNNPLEDAIKLMPSYLFLVGIILSVMTLLKVLRHFNIQFHFMIESLMLCGTSILFTLLCKPLLSHQYKNGDLPKRRIQFVLVEKKFAVLMGFTAGAMVFAHGSNDVAVAVGPLLVIDKIWSTENNHVIAILLFGIGGVVLGLIAHGRKVIATVGSGITTLTPSRAFAATFAAAAIVVISTSIGLPLSATQTLVGAVLGVALARGIGALNLLVIRNIIMSWAITLPVTSVLTILCYEILAGIPFNL